LENDTGFQTAFKNVRKSSENPELKKYPLKKLPIRPAKNGATVVEQLKAMFVKPSESGSTKSKWKNSSLDQPGIRQAAMAAFTHTDISM
jgi:hypothetical protein